MSEMSRADKRRVALAARAAAGSNCRYALGAVLVNGGRILATASNRQRNEGTNAEHENCTIHAEEAVLRLAKETASGATLYVVRVGRSGSWLSAKPCLRCHQQLLAAGVQKVVYTEEGGDLTRVRVSEENLPEPRKRYEYALVTA